MKRASRALALLLLPAFVLTLATTRAARPQGGAESGPPPSAHTVADAERAFARRSTEIGWREAFLEFFADDAISYAPAPGNAKERLLKRPATVLPQKVILDWWPVFADISRSGDMGLTTGPSLGYENTPERKEVYHGYYFSVWKRQPDGAWKVAIDVGVETPPAPPADSDRARLRTAPPSAWKPKRGAAGDASAELSALLARERTAGLLTRETSAAKNYAGLAREDVRLHRAGVLPLVGRQGVFAHLSDKARRLTWRPAAGDISRAADFAYTYGAYELTTRDGAAERGHYLHVWRRDAQGRWQLTADVMHAARER